MSSLTDFLAMGGYAPFVWPAFSAAAIIMVALAVFSRRALRANEATLEALRAARRAAREEASPGVALETENET